MTPTGLTGQGSEQGSLLRLTDIRLSSRHLYWAFVVLPVLPFAAAVVLFNKTIAVDLVNTNFVGVEEFHRPSSPSFRIGVAPPMVIEGGVILAIYAWGVALIAMIATAAVSAVTSMRVLYSAMGPHRWNAVIVAGLIAIVVFAYFVWSKSFPHNGISIQLINRTISALPISDRIGNTGSSIEAFLPIGTAVIVAIGVLALIAAVSLIMSNEEDRQEDASDLSRKLTLVTSATAATLILSLLTVHFLFEIGAEVIRSADPLPGIPVLRTLFHYQSLQQAMELYWGVIATIAMAAIYFPVATVLWLRTDERTRSDASHPLWSLSTRILTVISPLLAAFAVELVQAVPGI